jgi:thiamine biosynthesis lipoprotein
VKEEVFTHTIVAMGTIVTIQVSGLEADLQQPSYREETIERAFGWFRHIEDRCTRFNPQSESMQLTARIGVSVPVSPVLYECVAFALAVAEQSGGAFDPTVGGAMQGRGFNREYRTGQVVQMNLEPCGEVSYRDVSLDPARKAITLKRPLILDLGAVAKGLAIDMAARELRSFPSFAINAGGDLFLGGLNPEGLPWSIGIRHPREDDALIDSVVVSNRAVCTSGDYERRSTGEDDGHHIIDPRSGGSADAVASVTVVAQTAMLADALATAAFVLGPESGIQLLEYMGVEGLIVTPALDRYETRGMSVDYKLGAAPIL